MNESDIRTKSRIQAIEKATTSKGRTAYEIANVVHFNRTSGSNYMRYLHANGRVHIVAWELHRNTYAAVYLWGKGKDVPKPEPMTNTEGQRAYRERIRKDPELNEFYLARNRATERARSAAKAKKPQGWASALFAGRRVQEVGGRA